MLDGREARTAIREAGLRMTSQKEAVIGVLEGNRTHPAAEDVAVAVQQRFPGISLSTVYKTLNELADLGLIQRLDLPGAMRFDPDTHAHGHLVCTSCGTVVDVALEERDLTGLKDVARSSGCAVDGVSVSLRGLCSDCRADQSDTSFSYA